MCYDCNRYPEDILHSVWCCKATNGVRLHLEPFKTLQTRSHSNFNDLCREILDSPNDQSSRYSVFLLGYSGIGGTKVSTRIYGSPSPPCTIDLVSCLKLLTIPTCPLVLEYHLLPTTTGPLPMLITSKSTPPMEIDFFCLIILFFNLFCKKILLKNKFGG